MKMFFNKTIFKILQFVITISLLTYIMSKFEINTKNIFIRIDRFGFILLAVPFVLAIKPAVANKRWKILLQYSGIKENIFQLIKINWMSVFLAFFLPFASASDVFKMYFIEKKYPEKRGFSGASVIADRMIGFVLFCILGIIGSLFLPNTEEMTDIRIIIFSVFILIVLLILIITNKKIYSVTFSFLNKISFLRFIFMYIINLHKNLTILPYKKILPKVLPLVLIFQLSNILIAYFIFLSVGVTIPFFYHLAFLPVIQIITLLPVSFAGLGFREGLFIYFYGFLDLSAEVAFSVSIIYFLITVGIPAIIGGTLILFEKLKLM